jgi:NADH:ubiquinone oxidoreductase subunit 5 (subunit L)/multisubunit Na+/H+ antiporter MnhA subunit
MAEVVEIQGAGSTAKLRSPVWVAVWTILTLGIYGLVWYYKVNREMADLGKASGRTEELGDSAGKSLLAVTLGALIIVPAIISMVHTFQRVQALQRITQSGEPINGWLGLVLYLVFSPALFGYMQSGLNGAWQKQAQSGGTLTAAPAGVSEPAPIAP